MIRKFSYGSQGFVENVQALLDSKATKSK